MDPEAEDILMTGIADMLNTKRNFESEPLTQEEIAAVIEISNKELLKKNLPIELVHFYNRVNEFLKTKIIYQ